MQQGFYPMDEVFFALCKRIDTPISLSFWLKFKYSHREYLESKLPIADYLEKDVDRFKGDYAVFSYLSKWKGLDAGYNLDEIAIQSFKTSEVRCLETNNRLRSSRRGAIDPLVSSLLYTSKRKIAKLLGPMSLQKIEPFFGWGPGATYDIRRRQAQVDRKLTTVPMTVSGRALELLESVIRQDLHWSWALLNFRPEGDWSFAPGTFRLEEKCRVKAVPKSAKTNRLIAIEPTGNLFLQKGVGGFLRKQLMRHGVDLNDQGVNQEYAAKAVENGLATLDLSAASDTLSKELVYELLPFDWANLLDSLRSHSALLSDGSVVALEKFSSMGNGFTFELESLIFWALMSSVVEKSGSKGVLSVYGDDIVINREAYDEAKMILEFCGFQLNVAKSYHSGLFFESCGRHFFNGFDVTPPYQKEVFTTQEELIRGHNRLIRWSDRVGMSITAHAPFLRSSSGKYRLTRIPYGDSSDSGFLCSQDESLLAARRLDSNRGYAFFVTKPSSRRLPGHEGALLALYLRESSKTLNQLHSCDWPPEKVIPSMGDVLLPEEKTSVSGGARFGYRWIIPADRKSVV